MGYTIDQVFEQNGQSRTLYVLLHGFRGRPLTDVGAAARAADRDADLLLLQADLYLLSSVRSEDIVAGLAESVVAVWARRCAGDGLGYDRIILVGHSYGAVLLRKLILVFNGFAPDVPVSGAVIDAVEGRLLARRIVRLVQISGMNRGWNSAATNSFLTKLRWRAGEIIGSFFPHLTIFDVRKGAPFLVATRLQWLAFMARPDSPNLLCVQMLGTVDGEVSHADGIDFAVDFSASGEPEGSKADEAAIRRYFLIEVPFTDHQSAIVMEAPARADDRSPQALRWRLTQDALVGDERRLAAVALDRKLLEDSIPRPPNHTVRQVTFVVHGIRDAGFWTQKIARKIRQAAGGAAQEHRSVTESYGYFAMVPFLFPFTRFAKVEWLMDLYVETRARYPKADFNYVGHSNGTYLLAGALRFYPDARFRHVAFAGSVVRSDFDWAAHIRAGRVTAVLNFVAAADWVVAIFPNAFRLIRWFDLGAAGHSGFRESGTVLSLYDGAVRVDETRVLDLRFLEGGHSAGVKEHRWDDIGNFIVNGAIGDPSHDSRIVSKQGWLARLLAMAAPLPLLGILGIVIAIGWFIIAAVFNTPDITAHEAAIRAAGFMLYLAAIKLVVTRI